MIAFSLHNLCRETHHLDVDLYKRRTYGRIGTLIYSHTKAQGRTTDLQVAMSQPAAQMASAEPFNPIVTKFEVS